MSDTVKISLAFAVSLIVMVLAAGRWQGGVDTSITMLFEKVVSNQGDIKSLVSDMKKIEERLNEHLETPCSRK